MTITTEEMTRFLLSLDRAVETVFAAIESARAGETYVPRVAAARIVDVASTLIDGRDIRVDITGVRPGEKTHEIMVSEEECHRTVARGDYYVMLPELRGQEAFTPALTSEYSSSEVNLEGAALRDALAPFMAGRP